MTRFYREEYDSSDKVQNHFIRTTWGVQFKHDYLHSVLFDSMGKNVYEGTFLEIACGSGHLISEFKKAHPAWECFGVDPSLENIDTEALGPTINWIPTHFDDSVFKAGKFDIIVAHGLLNRTPTLPALKSIARCCREGALVSLELMLLDDSECTPYIYDHSYVFSGEVFETYLSHAGFSIISHLPMGATHHYLCFFHQKAVINGELDIGRGSLVETRRLYNSHLSWWNTTLSNAERALGMYTDAQLMLFGAGMYSAILYWLLPERYRLSYAIDELKAGVGSFFLPVISIQDARVLHDRCGETKTIVLLCARPTYMQPIMEKLVDAGLEFHPVNAEL